MENQKFAKRYSRNGEIECFITFKVKDNGEVKVIESNTKGRKTDLTVPEGRDGSQEGKKEFARYLEDLYHDSKDREDLREALEEATGAYID